VLVQVQLAPETRSLAYGSLLWEGQGVLSVFCQPIVPEGLCKAVDIC